MTKKQKLDIVPENPRKRELPKMETTDHEGAGSVQARMKLLSDIESDPKNIRKINHTVDIPYEKVEEGPAPKVTIEAIRSVIRRRQWGKLLEMAFSLFFGRKNEVRALGFYETGLRYANAQQMTDVMEQLDAQMHPEDAWKKKMKGSIIRAETEYMLFRRGYRRMAGAGIAVSSLSIPSGSATTIADFVPETILEDIRSERIVGPLTTSQKLPPGAFLFFDKNGYPIAVAETEEWPTSVPMYEKQEEDIGEEKKGAFDTQSRIAYLRSIMEPGDIVFTNEREEGKTGAKKAFVTIGRLLQSESGDEGFFSVHVGVVNEQLGISHVRKNGGEHSTLEELFDLKNPKRYNAISVARIDASPAQRLAFARAAHGAVSETKEYDSSAVVGYMAQQTQEVFAGAPKKTFTDPNPHDRKSLCFHVTQKAGQQTGLPSIAQQDTALGLFKHLNVIASIAV